MILNFGRKELKWVKNKESMTINNPIEGPPATIKQGRLQPAIRSLNVRIFPSMNAPVLYILREGVKFFFATIPDNPDWYTISCNEISYECGYAMSKYIIEASGDSS